MSDGRWTAVDSGIGAGVDSYFEYLVKGGIMFGKTKLIDMFRGKVEYESIKLTAPLI